jgi:hypothetical protein
MTTTWHKTPFGDALHVEVPADCTAIIVGVHKHQWIPLKILLPHQLYRETIERLLLENDATELVVIPYDSKHLKSFKADELFPTLPSPERTGAK